MGGARAVAASCALWACGSEDAAAPAREQEETVRAPASPGSAPGTSGAAAPPSAPGATAGSSAGEGSGLGPTPIARAPEPAVPSSGSAAPGTDGEAPAAPEPEPGSYGVRALLLAPNSEMAVGELDGKIYVVGGYPASRVTQNTVQAFDPATNSWALVEPLPFGVHHPVVAGVQGRLYSLGGQTDAGDTGRSLAYDPVANAWTDVAPMPTPRGAGAAAVIDDRIYVIAGRPPAGNAFEVYDISDDAWTVLSELPQAFPERNHLAAAAAGGKVYAAGGRHSGANFQSPMTASLDIYDPATDRWQAGAPLPRPRGGVNGVLAFGCFHVWGGEGQGIGEPNDVFPDHDVYDPRSDVWISVADLPTPVHGVTGAAFVDGLIYIPGGGTSSGGSSGVTLFQVYRPDVTCE